MLLYRACDINDLVYSEGSLWVNPKNFKTNKDTSIPNGCWSFWFNQPVRMGEVLVESEFTPDLQSQMQFSFVESFSYGETHGDYQIEEFVTSQPQKVKKIWVETVHTTEWMVFHPKKEYIVMNGGNWVKENLLPKFPYLVNGVRYDWGMGIGQKPTPFDEFLSKKIFYFCPNERLELNSPYTHYIEYHTISTQLLEEMTDAIYMGDMKGFSYIYEIAEILKKEFFDYPDYY